ncbi:MAG: 50S ribosomal protein L25, partial [Bacteroidales bacterium]|nr:50S ribosomal protein L25 [Bacteroidales bacterium]
VTERKEVGKKSTKELRKQGMVPCVMYGGEKNLHFYASENDFRHIIFTDDVFVVNLDVEGKKHSAVIKDMQFHPVTDATLHMDFTEVVEGKPTIVAIPVRITGTSKGILAGGKLRVKKRYLIVKGMIKDIPEFLELDITDLGIGDSYKVRDLKFDNLEILDTSQALVLGVVTSRLAAKGEADVVEAEGEAEEGGSEAAAE